LGSPLPDPNDPEQAAKAAHPAKTKTKRRC
jgi:hypothetical protein